MSCGSLRSEAHPLAVQVRYDELSYSFSHAVQMEILGTMFDACADTTTSVEHRLRKGEACFWKNWKVLSGPGTVCSKLRAWHAAPSSSAAFGSGCWHVSKHLLVRLQRWEWNLLLKMLKMRWKPDEGKMQYNKRTHALIVKWLSENRIVPLFCKILHAVFKSAWREKCLTSHGGINYLSLCRNFRTRAWWEGIKDLHYYRSRVGLVFEGTGHVREWEEVFCDTLGMFWRSTRDACTSFNDWKTYWPSFRQKAAQVYGMPLLANWCESPRHPPDVTKERRTSRLRLADIPAAHGDDLPHISWNHDRDSFVLVVDCKPLAEVMNGIIPLRTACLNPVFERMTRRMFSLLGVGCHTSTPTADPVFWHRRDYNKIADFLVNYAMDNTSDHFEEFPDTLEALANSGANFLCHSDGGTRGSKCSGIGWCVDAIITDRDQTSLVPLARGARYLSEPVSSFTAETLALDEATRYLSEFVLNHYNRIRKRARFN